MRKNNDFLPFPQRPGYVQPLVLSSAGRYQCLGGERFKRDNFSFWTFEYVLKGSGYLNVNGRIFQPSAGDMYVLPKGSSHEYYPEREDPWEKIWFKVDGQLLEVLLTTYRLGDVYFIKNFGAVKLFVSIFNLYSRQVLDKNMAAALLLHELVQQMSDSYYTLENKALTPEVQKLLDYINTRENFRFSLKSIQSVVAKSTSQLIRVFKREIGVTPYEYALQRRYEKACLMLEYTALTLKQISCQLGFTDQYYFSNFFKKRSGVTPRFYRQGLAKGL